MYFFVFWFCLSVLFCFSFFYNRSLRKMQAGTEWPVILIPSQGCGCFVVYPCHVLLGTKKRPGEEGKGKDPHPARVLPILWFVRCGRAAIHFPLSPGWASSDPLFGSWQRGSPTWDSWSYFAKVTRIIGKRDEGREVPNIDESERSGS